MKLEDSNKDVYNESSLEENNSNDGSFKGCFFGVFDLLLTLIQLFFSLIGVVFLGALVIGSIYIIIDIIF